jgi:hypothetical protein
MLVQSVEPDETIVGFKDALHKRGQRMRSRLDNEGAGSPLAPLELSGSQRLSSSSHARRLTARMEITTCARIREQKNKDTLLYGPMDEMRRKQLL